MFQFLRKLIGPIMITVLVAFAATIIFQWGGWYSGQPVIGEINGEKISPQEFDRVYTNLLYQEQQANEGDVPAEKMEELRQQAWNQLVANHLMDAEYEKRQIHISSKEIYNFLRMYPPQDLQQAQFFQTEGQFDYQKYLAAMRDPQYAQFWAQVEASIMPDLRKIKLQEEILSTVRVTPAEVLRSYLEEKEKVKIGYVNIPAGQLQEKIEPPTEEELQAYYEENKENYAVGERAQLDVVSFNKEASEDDWSRGLYQANELYDSVMAGADFGEMAEAYSDDPGSAARGGDLNWFTRGRMVPGFDSVVFNMEVGEISKPAKSRFGYHVIKLLDVRMTGQGEEAQEERHAAHILVKVDPSAETLEQIRLNARDFIETAKEVGFATAAEEYNFDVNTTSPFTKNSYIPYIGNNEEVKEFIFKSKPGTVGNMVETSNAVVAYAVDTVLPASYTEFENVKNSIRSTLLKERALELATDTAQVIQKAVVEGTAFTQVPDRYGFDYKRSDFITRNSTISNIGNAPEVIGAAFGLEEENDISKPITYDKGAAVITLLERQSPDLTQFNQVQDSVKYALMQEKHQQAYNRWFNEMYESADIVNNLDQFFGGGS